VSNNSEATENILLQQVLSILHLYPCKMKSNAVEFIIVSTILYVSTLVCPCSKDILTGQRGTTDVEISYH
jgi:hypothetical protein